MNGSPESVPGPVLAVIPARWESSRFPGKVLAPLAGRPVLAWVIDAVRATRRVDGVLVATDEARVAEAAAVLGVEAALTSADHASGTDRIGEAVRGREAGVVVNVQGDEPLVPPEAIDTLVTTLLDDPEADVGTLACPLEEDERDDPNSVKVVITETGRALYFSRADVPAVHPTAHRRVPSLRHVGLYAYRRSTLDRFLSLPPTRLEAQEGLEQLRLLEAGARFAVGTVPSHPRGIDTPADLARCERVLAQRGGAL
jgi:3-deoxy-manno-octulosonate cytidylyltransferase (CMP-KDO synthetase)